MATGPEHYRKIREEVAREHASFFTFGEIAGAGAEMPADSNAFLGYAPDFVYRYVPVPGMTFSQLISLGLDSARQVMGNIH